MRLLSSDTKVNPIERNQQHLLKIKRKKKPYLNPRNDRRKYTENHIELKGIKRKRGEKKKTGVGDLTWKEKRETDRHPIQDENHNKKKQKRKNPRWANMIEAVVGFVCMAKVGQREVVKKKKKGKIGREKKKKKKRNLLSVGYY
ncbi:hypothetical protein ACOSP7_011349 [Xanthoceras sorbifolium]